MFVDEKTIAFLDKNNKYSKINSRKYEFNKKYAIQGIRYLENTITICETQNSLIVNDVFVVTEKGFDYFNLLYNKITETVLYPNNVSVVFTRGKVLFDSETEEIYPLNVVFISYKLTAYDLNHLHLIGKQYIKLMIKTLDEDL